MTEAKPPLANRRQGGRKRVLFGGRVVYSGGDVILDCSLVDVSETGARIRLPKGQGIPSRIQLIDIRNRCAYDATVAWLKPPLAGLRFENCYPIDQSLPPQLGYLRRIWAEAATR